MWLPRLPLWLNAKTSDIARLRGAEVNYNPISASKRLRQFHRLGLFVAVFAFVSVALITMVNLVSRVLGLSAFVGFIIGLLVYVLLRCAGWAVDCFARRLEVSNDHIGASG